tara:strand:+ start:7368 stop:8633 length:1266 start_codon:yes stop_codon:yes gene_type:complete
MHDYESRTTTSAGNAGGTSLIDDQLPNLTEDDDGITGWVRIAHDGDTSDGEVRRIKRVGGYTGSTTTIVPVAAFSGQIGNAITYELHRTNPTDKLNAIRRSLEVIYPFLYLPIRDESLFVDNRLSNSGFEETIDSGAHPSWTNVNSPTVSTETTIVWHGSQAAKMISAAGSAGQMTQSPSVNINELAGKTATLEGRGWVAAASQLRLRIDWDGSSFANSDYHTGDSSWRKLSASGTVPTDATQIKCICEIVAGTVTGYFDDVTLRVGPVFKYTIPTTILKGPHMVEMQYNANNIEGPYYPIPHDGVPIAGRALRLRGMGLLSRPTTDSGTTEIDGVRVDVVVEQALQFLKESEAEDSYSQQQEDFLKAADRAETRLDKLKGQPGARMAGLPAQIPDGSWHIEEDSSGRYIIFDAVRGSVVE